LALLALAARGERSRGVLRGVNYLLATLPGLSAAISIGWGVLALRAHRAFPAAAGTLLAEAYHQAAGRPASVVGLALLLLAADENAPNRFLLPAMDTNRPGATDEGRHPINAGDSP